MKKLTTVVLAALLLAVPALAVRGDGAAEREASSVEERRLQVSIQEEMERLRQREENVRRREMELKTLEEQVDKKLADMRKLREELAVLLSEKEETENRRIRDLGQMYEKMDPGRAALLLADLEDDLAVEILSAMKKKSAGRVLGAMEQQRATRLSEAYPVQGGR